MTKNELINAIRELNNDLSLTELRKQKKAELETILLNLQEPETDDEELTVAQKMSKKLREARERYDATIAYSGNKSADNGDEVAQALRSLEPKQVVEAAERILGLSPGELWTKYEGLNPGQQRMNAGNRIRGAIRRGDVEPKEALAQLH